MTPSTRAIGDRGEKIAAEELQRLGYRIIETNFVAHGGEIDIIAEKGGALVFVEVKSRADDRFGTPFDAVGPVKKKRMLKAARAYIALRRIFDRVVRFDVAGVNLGASAPTVEIIENAFGEDLF